MKVSEKRGALKQGWGGGGGGGNDFVTPLDKLPEYSSPL